MDVLLPVDIGTDFLGYRIEESIGRGGMGVVWSGPTRRIAVTENEPTGGGPCLTSISIGAHSAWVTVAPPAGFTCIR